MALSRDDKLLESMQEFRIFGRVDHILGIGMTTFSESIEKYNKIGNHTIK